jgi:hypothetical protein
MDFSSISVAGPLFTSGAALIVGGVTRWTQRGVARDRIQWEARLEIARLNEARFAVALDHLIQAADAANRYIVRSGDIDITDYEAREPYVLAILDPIGRARVEVAALPPFPGDEQVDSAIKALERLVQPPESAKALMAAWQPEALGTAITKLSRARNLYVEVELAFASVKRKPWRALFARRFMLRPS